MVANNENIDTIVQIFTHVLLFFFLHILKKKKMGWFSPRVYLRPLLEGNVNVSGPEELIDA